MNSDALTEDEEKILIVILLSQGSVSEKTVKKVLGLSDEVLSGTRSSLVSQDLMHDLTPDLQFGKHGEREALKIFMKRLFPKTATEKSVSSYDAPGVGHISRM